jgi:hypothetical protein
MLQERKVSRALSKIHLYRVPNGRARTNSLLFLGRMPGLSNSNSMSRFSSIKCLAPLLGLALAVHLASAQETPKDTDKPNFRHIAEQFDADLHLLREPTLGSKSSTYNTSDVNEVLKRAKVNTLRQIPSHDAPLDRYVKARFPRPIDGTSNHISVEDADVRFREANNLLRTLSQLSSYQLDLTVNTHPSDALFELSPHVGSPQPLRTNGTITNVYRGEYDYRITKASFKTVTSTINFIDRSGSILDCRLQKETDPDPTLPCDFR